MSKTFRFVGISVVCVSHHTRIRHQKAPQNYFTPVSKEGKKVGLCIHIIYIYNLLRHNIIIITIIDNVLYCPLLY